jgi:hypothetical protein
LQLLKGLRMGERKATLLSHQIRSRYIGRSDVLEILEASFQSRAPRVFHVSGIAGIGKSTLLVMLSERVRAAGGELIKIECRTTEPTESGFTHSLGLALLRPGASLDELSICLGELGAKVFLALDTYEVFRLLDTWLRQNYIPSLPGNVRIILLSREKPLAAWFSSPGWSGFFRSLTLESFSEEEARALLLHQDVADEASERIVQFAHGHPLALQLSASAYRARPELNFQQDNLQLVLQELTQMFLNDVDDPALRGALERVSVVRRTTVSLLKVLLPEIDPDAAYVKLSGLPYVDINSDGLLIHEVVREAIANTLRARDPAAFLEYRHRAWKQLISEVSKAGSNELWRYTADMLYLIENPVVREAFFPRGSNGLAVEPAGKNDADVLSRIIKRHEGAEAAGLLEQWWKRMPQIYSVIRGLDGEVTGIYCKMEPAKVSSAWLAQDPITQTWMDHLEDNPIPEGQTVLFCRRWLSLDEGEQPSDSQAAAWLDLKRTYMEMRPNLRRIYLTVSDLPAYGPVAQRLGFEVLAEHEISLDGRGYHSAVLDFGPDSVDGWLSDLAATELGIERGISILDVSARELVLDSGRIALTPLEFGVFNHLVDRMGEAVSRRELLLNVWGTSYEGGSNVVDSVVRGLRQKMGGRAGSLETVTGVGYRFRQ